MRNASEKEGNHDTFRQKKEKGEIKITEIPLAGVQKKA